MTGATAMGRHLLRDSRSGVEVAVLSIGAVVQDWRVPVAGGAPVGVVLGYDDPQDYLRQPGYFGAIVGRYANRIGGARFDLNGVTHHLDANEHGSTLHGGPAGWSRRIWDLAADGPAGAVLSLKSAHGDQGFPGQVDVTVTIRLDGYTLTYDMLAVPDRETPVSMAVHNYYTLAGRGTIWDSALQVAASATTPTTPDLIPTGEIRPVEGTRHDFRQMRRLGDASPDHAVTDINFVLDTAGGGPNARLRGANGMTLDLWTDAPGLQVYTGQGIRPFGTPLPGQDHLPCTGIALEPQCFPDAPNQPGFPPAMFSPDWPFRQRTAIAITPPEQP